jgi:hypothetical protein|tara:strand:+ start:1275 stop:2207 length:933 start_codon:yes stop_codon:yes gene_type:complete
MKTFFRIFDNKLYGIQRENIGFSVNDAMYIPDEYLENKKFMVMRTCHGIGDWVLLSGMPRLLKEKYSDCKVYVPSSVMLKKIFGEMLNNWGYGTFDASKISEIVFESNPYVDGFVDEIDGEIFHDHYKIFDESNDKVPLLKQMLMFWQFKDDEMLDTTPDFYPNENEKEWIKRFTQRWELDKYSYISVSSTFGNTSDSNILIEQIKRKDFGDMKWLYYGEVPLRKSPLNFLDAVEIKELNLSIREQQYLKVNAKYNFGNETGMNLWTPKYSETYVIGNKYYGPVHGGNNEGKVRKRPFKSGNFVNRVNYL